jgi:hypothetical protein
MEETRAKSVGDSTFQCLKSMSLESTGRSLSHQELMIVPLTGKFQLGTLRSNYVRAVLYGLTCSRLLASTSNLLLAVVWDMRGLFDIPSHFSSYSSLYPEYSTRERNSIFLARSFGLTSNTFSKTDARSREEQTR